MGAWGDGIFENDRALDEFAETYNDLICRLMRAVDPTRVGEWAQLAEARVLAYMVGLIARGCSNHDMFTRNNAITWRASAVEILSRNFRDSYKAEETEIKTCVDMIAGSFQMVIDHAAPDDADADDQAAYDRYAVWLRIQDEIHDKIDRHALAEDVLRSRARRTNA